MPRFSAATLANRQGGITPTPESRTILDERIRAYCEAAGLELLPWEAAPWQVRDGPPPPRLSPAYKATWIRAQEFRRKILDALGE